MLKKSNQVSKDKYKQSIYHWNRQKSCVKM